LEEEEEVSTIALIQTNLQHSIVASRVLSRTVSVEGKDMALIQEPWYREGHIRSLNIPGYTLFSAGGIDRPRACILTRNESAWILPGFSSRGLIAVPVKHNEDGAERRLVLFPHICPMIPRIFPPQRNLRNSCDIVKGKPPI
jgi:hypothetical protein